MMAIKAMQVHHREHPLGLIVGSPGYCPATVIPNKPKMYWKGLGRGRILPLGFGQNALNSRQSSRCH